MDQDEREIAASLTLKIVYYAPNPGQWTGIVEGSVIESSPDFDGIKRNLTTAWGSDEGESIGAELSRCSIRMIEDSIAAWADAAEKLHLEVAKRQIENIWTIWLDEQLEKNNYTKDQIDKARQATRMRPKIFVHHPTADDYDGVLSITWRSGDWTLMVDILRDGSDEWRAVSFSQAPAKAFYGYESISEALNGEST